MPKKITLQELKQRLNKIFGDIVSIDEKTFKNTTTECRFIDKDYGEFWNKPITVIYRKRGHKQRFLKNKKLSLEEFKQRLNKIHSGNVILDETTYVCGSIKCRFIDKDYGEFWKTPNKIMTRKERHPEFGRVKKTISLKFIKQKLKETHGDIVVLDESTYRCIRKKAKFIDKDYGEWWTYVSDVIKGTIHPKRNRANQTTPLAEIKQKIKEIHGNKVIIDDTTYVKAYAKCRFIDKDFGEFWKTPARVISRKEGHPKRAQEKYKQTCIDKYGCENPMQNEEVHNKFKQTCIETYGADNPMKNKKIRNKAKKTCLKLYGVETPLESPEIQQKARKTCVIKYGVLYPAQNLEIAAKSARNQTISTILKHWFSNEDIICQASYEVKVVKYLNNNHIDYNWKPQIFTMPDGKTYTPDLYLPDQDLWVEIKGYFRKDAKKKWDWFHKEHPNSELWDKTKLTELNLI